MRQPIACFKLLLFVILCLFILIMQAIGQFIFKNSKLFFLFPTLFGRLTLLIFRIKVTLEGFPPSQHNLIYVGNHISYIDIPVLGAFIPAAFIAKADVRQWPLLGILGKVSGTVFIERQRNAALKTIHKINKALEQKRSLIIFPEGTSTNGTSVLPFKSSLFEIFLSQELKNKISIQPFTLKILGVNGQAIKQPTDRNLYAWYGDMTLLPHLWNIAKSKGVHIRIIFHPLIQAQDHINRKDFALQCHNAVTKGLENNDNHLDFKAKPA